MIRKKKSLPLYGVILLFLWSCSNLKTRKEINEGDSDASMSEMIQESRSKEMITQEREDDKTFGGEVVSAPQLKIQKVGVILSPGGSRALAHTGVLKELLKSKIPIDLVVGMEWGALVGGLYAMNSKVHEAEWKLYKIQRKELLKRSLFSKAFESQDLTILKDFFDKNIGEVSFSNLKTSFACPSISIWSGAVVWQDRGSLKKGIGNCLPFPPLFKPKNPWMASLFSLDKAIDYMKKKGMDVIVVVNVLGRGDLFEKEDLLSRYESALLWYEAREQLIAHDEKRKKLKNLETENKVEWVNVNTRKYKIYNFSDAPSLIRSGEMAGKRMAKTLIKKYGF